MMKIATPNPALMTAKADIIAPQFMQLVRSALTSGTYLDERAMSRRAPEIEARKISLSAHSGPLHHRMELYLTPHKEEAVVNFDFSAFKRAQEGDELGFSFLGYAEYAEIGDVQEGQLIKAAALTKQLFSISVDDVLALAVRHSYGLAKGVEIYLNAPH